MTTTDPPVDARVLRDMVDERAIRRLHAHDVDDPFAKEQR